ncbi:MAG: gamma carbonic anhydrase family protein [Oligoflexia bacterium]|nr:gamma carbonic anhydrase family protein [Oligoflexia bacterium]
MALIKPLRGITPTWGEECYFAENATIIGDVTMGRGCSVWFHTVIRGDVHSIRIGDRCSIQDGAVIHCTYQKASTVIGNEVTVGHRAIIHGAVVEDLVLIGMGAIVLDHAVVKSGSIVAAGAVVREGSVLESGALYAGVPAKKIKMLDEEDLAMIKRLAKNYITYTSWYK